MTILWETTHAASSMVAFGPSEFNTGKAVLSQRIQDTGMKYMHELTLGSLSPETNYFYQVLSVTEAGDTIQSDVIPFQTAVKEDTPFAFTVFSDSQNNPTVWSKITGNANEERPNFAVHAGDLVGLGYRKSEWVNEFFAPAKHFMKQIPIFSTLGNHEHDASYYYQYMKNPEPEHYYTFRYGNAAFFMIDTDQYQEPGTAMYHWLERALAESTATWKFVVQHHPPYSSEENDYGNTLFESSLQGDDEARFLVPLYEKYGVDMVFSGHLHMYERTWPILDGKVVERDGVRYYILGGSGGGLEKAAPNRVWFTNKVRTLHHYAYIAINGDHLQYHAIDLEGNLFDHFSLTGPRPKKSPSQLVPTTPVPLSNQRKFTDGLLVELETASPQDDIFYTLDGSAPNRKSNKYTAPIELKENSELNAVAYNKNGVGPQGSFVFKKTPLYPAVKNAQGKSGADYIYYTGKLKDPTKPLADQLEIAGQGTIPKLDWNLVPHKSYDWGTEIRGYIEVPESGRYVFGGHAYQLFTFYLHDELLLSEYNREVSVTEEIYLEAGLHPFRLVYHLPDRYDTYGRFDVVTPSGKKIPVSQLNVFAEK
ncbi:Purple acid phosphatase [Lunatimonas lonarensis]|uniref:Purple acid phosphatase n=1 Tax=Lunatimonas lonarensis TaxID=1232681 RepID=R7ZYG6_9BACT|nr:metallophosphoesterase [Lunatimonas lonarensis]EON79120.1 Purple acid phosphatase [Lunatimonas lonarensis]